MTDVTRSGPLTGVRVVEIAGQGPGPFASMMLSDMGAEVLKVDRAGAVVALAERQLAEDFVFQRGRRSVAVDLKHPDGAEVVLRLVERADALIEGFRPGVVERLGIGPDACLARNPALVYGRMTGWGQDGPWAHAPGHDINYVALTGLLHSIGPADAPVPALNLIGDYGGGGMLLAFGIVSGLIEARSSGHGQVIDANMLDGASLLGGIFYGMHHRGRWAPQRASNLLDGGAPYYGVYKTSDGRFVAIGSMEPKFYAALLEGLGLAGADLPDQNDTSAWPQMRERFADIFGQKTRDEWCALLEPLGPCFAPVLGFDEALEHEHAVARNVYVEHDGARQPGPAPRFSRTPGRLTAPSSTPGEHTQDALEAWGFAADELAALLSSGAIAQAA
jgi:alpha-methylacyl-CoA racemase